MEARKRGLAAATAAAAALALSAGLSACGDEDGEAELTAPGAPVNAAPASQRDARLDKLAVIGRPTYIAQPPGDTSHLYVTKKSGEIRVLEDEELIDEPFLDLSEQINAEGSEQGLFSIAFAPDYAESGLFYVVYNLDDNSVQVDEYRRDGDDPLKADPDSRRAIINAPHGKGERTQHNGGQLQFGPDGLLYISFGDGGPVMKEFVSNRAQQRSVLLGKILRIDPTPSGDLPYTIPADNPFVDRPGVRGEIYAYGLRNPYRFSFDSNGGLIIGDPGALDVEEIDYMPPGEAKGANFGWPHYEGNEIFLAKDPLELDPGKKPVFPIHSYSHDKGCSVIGGYVIRDPRLPQLDGRYIYGDACSGDIRTLIASPDGAREDKTTGLRLSPTETYGVVSFGQGTDRRIYAVSLNGGVYALNPKRK